MDSGSITVGTPPTCTITECTPVVAPETGYAPMCVNFGVTIATVNCDGEITYEWDFGDGEISDQQEPVHTYMSAGTYNWTLTVNVDDSADPQTAVRTGTVVVENVPSDRVFLEFGSAEGFPGDQVEIPIRLHGNGNGNICGTGNDITYDPDFLTFVEAVAGPAAVDADKSANVTTDTGFIRLGIFGINQNPIADGVVAYLRFTINSVDPGVSCMTATASSSDCAGTDLLTGGNSAVVSVPDCAVTCSASAGGTGGNIPYDVSFASTVDITGCSGAPSYHWEFGDGATANTANASHTYTTVGTYTWIFTVTVDGQTCSETGTITTSVVPPIVTQVKKQGAPFRIVVKGSNLQNGLAVYIDGTYWGDTTNKKLVKWKNAGKIKIKKGGSLKALFPKGHFTEIMIVNPDGGCVRVDFDRKSKIWRFIDNCE